jgi:hypothetical protein
MHRRDADPDYRPPDDSASLRTIVEGDAKTNASDGRGDNQRQYRQTKVISRASVRLIGQHRNEMGSPDPAATCRGVQSKPDMARPAAGRLSPLKKADRDTARQKTYGHCERHKALIVFNGKAGEDFKHCGPFM